MNILGDETTFLTQILTFCEKIFHHLFVLNNLGDETSFLTKMNTLGDETTFLTQTLILCDKFFLLSIRFK